MPRRFPKVRLRKLTDLAGKPWFRDAYNFTVKDLQPFNQSGHFCAQQFCQADMEAKGVTESVFENDARAACICHFAPALANAASDSARCSRTASGVKHEIRMPRVVLVCGELNRTIGSILFGISFKTPTYFPPPAATIDEKSVSPKARVEGYQRPDPIAVWSRSYSSRPRRSHVYSTTVVFGRF